MSEMVYVVAYSNGFDECHISEVYEDYDKALDATRKLNCMPGYFAWYVGVPIHRKEVKYEF